MLNGFFFNTPIDDNFIGHQIAEIFREKIYAPYIENKGLKTCLEVGGNLGIASYYFSQHFKEVFVLEPAREHFEVLVHQLAFNNITNVKPFPLALSNQDGQATFYHRAGNKTMWSLNPDMKGNDTEVVEAIRLGTFLKNNNIEKVDLLKLDCEGSEADIVCHTSFQENADKIDMVICEIHSWLGRNRQQLIDGFKMAGFTKITQIPNEADLIVCQK